jgi:type I restriction enzyme R subunit
VSNFAFLGAYSKSLAALGLAAEKIFPTTRPAVLPNWGYWPKPLPKEVAGRIGL